MTRCVLIVLFLSLPLEALCQTRLRKSICIRTQKGCARLIAKDTELPASFSDTFGTSEDDQEEVRISLYQGESEKLSENTLLGNFDLKISKGPVGTVRLQVTVVVDAEKNIKIKTHDQASGDKRELEAGVVK